MNRFDRRTDTPPYFCDLQIGLGLRLFETDPHFDLEERDVHLPRSGWLDEYRYRRLALPSVTPQRDRITSWEQE